MFASKVFAVRRQPLRVVACDCSRDKMGIFQVTPNLPVSISQARSAYEVCRTPYDALNYTNPSYTVFGVDGEMVEKYIDIVETLEATYVRSVVSSDPGIKINIGPFSIFITKTKLD